MRQQDFVARREPDWLALERWLRPVAGRGARRDGARAEEDLAFPARYRRLCQDLAIAQRRGYSPALLDRLEALMAAGHDALYRPPPPRWRRVADFIGAGLPRLARRHAGFVAVAAVLLFAPMLALGLLVQWRPELVFSVFDPEQVAGFERMFAPSAAHAVGRESGTNLQMFGFYVLNNVSIGFRTFASGLLACVGAIFVLVLNGVMIGATAGHLTQVGHGPVFWKFVAGHSGPELTAIVLAGAGGLRVGWALLAPGALPRRDALIAGARDGALLALGAFALLLVAAFVEAYWSSLGSRPAWLAYGSGIAGWLAIGAWLALGGRRAP